MSQDEHRWHQYSIGTGYIKKLSEFSGKKVVVFDAGPIISLTTSNLLSTLERLKEKYAGSFIIPESVKYELVDEPLQTKKFMFEALQVQRLISIGVLDVIEDGDVKELTLELLKIANHCFSAKGRAVQIVQYGEMASIAAAKLLDAEALVLDERITRELVEHPKHLTDLMGRRLHMVMNENEPSLKLLANYTWGLKILRSSELMAVAYEASLLGRYVANGEEAAIPNIMEKLLESVLWGLKLHGCAITVQDIATLTTSVQNGA